MRILESSEANEVVKSAAPLNIGIIMDGNRRWAAARQIPVDSAHLGVSVAVASCVRAAAQANVACLAFFALSNRNLLREPTEVASLSALHSWLWSDQLIATLYEVNADVSIVGLPHALLEGELASTRNWIRTSQQGMRVVFAVNYSSRQGHEALYPPVQASVPSIDLLVRTGGEQRLSDFLLLESAYAELVFTDTLWPDFTGLHLLSAVREYMNRSRRFGA